MASITLSNNGTSVTLSNGLRVERQAGRPESRLAPVPDKTHPIYYDPHRSASDVFSITGQFLFTNAESDGQTLIEDIIRPLLGTDTLTLTFDSSLFGLSSYTVFPEGSRAARISYAAGDTAVVYVDDLTLRVVQ